MDELTEDPQNHRGERRESVLPQTKEKPEDGGVNWYNLLKVDELEDSRSRLEALAGQKDLSALISKRMGELKIERPKNAKANTSLESELLMLKTLSSDLQAHPEVETALLKHFDVVAELASTRAQTLGNVGVEQAWEEVVGAAIGNSYQTESRVKANDREGSFAGKEINLTAVALDKDSVKPGEKVIRRVGENNTFGLGSTASHDGKGTLYMDSGHFQVARKLYINNLKFTPPAGTAAKK